jgi:hypothetical protein
MTMPAAQSGDSGQHQRPPDVGLTESQWAQELAMAIKASGLPCKIFACECRPDSSTCVAQIDNMQSHWWLQIHISTNKFQTPEARQAEIVRQLSN